VDDQEEKARKLAKQRGYQVGEVVQDLDVSGGKSAAERGLGSLIESCERGEASAVIVWAFDRFSREHAWDAIESANRLRKKGARLLSVADGFDSDTEAGQSQIMYLAQGAHAYREMMRKRWAMTQERSLKRGAFPGVTPWGLLRNDDGTLRLDESLVPVRRELLHRRAEGAGINALCRWLVSESVRSPSGGKGWVHSALSPILASRNYLGEFKFGDQTYHNPALAIATEEEWQAAQLKKGGIVPKTGKTTENALCRGIARCTGCGRTLKILYTRRQGNRLSYYCKNPSAKGPCPARALVRLEVLDPFVEAWFLDTIKDDVRVAGAVAARERAAETQRAVEEAERELAPAPAMPGGVPPEWVYCFF
jgi:site-specific DNA recombinase